MKKITLLLVILIIQVNLFAQKADRQNFFQVEIKGNSDGEPVILIPGLACSGQVWKETVDILQKDFQCHILTLAGFAQQKPMPLENGFLPVIQANITDYIKNELKTKPIIIGHSLGGFMALSIASSSPDLVKQIVIVDSYPFYSAMMMPTATEETAKPQAEMMKKMMLSAPDSLREKQQQMTMASMITAEDKIPIATKWSLQSDQATVAQAMYELMTTDLREEVETVKCPILVFGSWYAAKDYGITKESVEKNYQDQFAKAADCTIKVADTAKHFVMWDEPEWFQNNLNDFIKK